MQGALERIFMRIVIQKKLFSSLMRRCVLIAGCVFVSGLLGCSSAKVVVNRGPAKHRPMPNAVMVYDFAVSPNEVGLDRGVASKIKSDSEDYDQTKEEIKVGRIVADALSKYLVAELQKMDIAAFRAKPGSSPTETTLVISGQFLQVDQGNRTVRTLVGFGLGGTELRTRVDAYQGGELIAEAYTRSKSGLKPGMAVMAPAGAAAVAGGTTVVSEVFLSTVEADARRTAKAVAKEIGKAYVRKGWLAADALK